MIDFFKKNWDIFGGVIISVVMTVLAKFQLQTIQLCYSIIILILLNIGVLRVIKQSLDKNKDEKRKTLIDQMVDGQKVIKAISIAQNPTKDGEMLGQIIIKLMEGVKNIMKKLFDKFKGIVLAVALGVLTIVEGYGGYINELCGGVLIVNEVEILPLITFVASLVVGIISNCWTKEQKAKIKALLKSSTAVLVIKEAKKSQPKTSETNKELTNL